MLSNFKSIVKSASQLFRRCEFQNLLVNNGSSGSIGCSIQKLNFHTTRPDQGKLQDVGRKHETKQKDSLVDAKEIDFDMAQKRKEGFFPTVELPETLFSDIPFKDLPIVFVKVTKNNTIMTVVHKGISKIHRSCGCDGFKNTRKGTNVAAQTTGLSVGLRSIKNGLKTVRVVINGLGPGRVSSLKGLQLAGVEIVSITDKTIDASALRPKKQRRI